MGSPVKGTGWQTKAGGRPPGSSWYIPHQWEKSCGHVFEEKSRVKPERHTRVRGMGEGRSQRREPS